MQTAAAKITLTESNPCLSPPSLARQYHFTKCELLAFTFKYLLTSLPAFPLLSLTVSPHLLCSANNSSLVHQLVSFSHKHLSFFYAASYPWNYPSSPPPDLSSRTTSEVIAMRNQPINNGLRGTWGSLELTLDICKYLEKNLNSYTPLLHHLSS